MGKSSKRISIETLRGAAKQAGLSVKTCGKGHVQVLGGISIVNFYNGKKGTTIYTQGTSSGRVVTQVEQVIAAATRPPKKGLEKAKRSKSYRAVRERKWKTSRVCHWCKEPFARFSDTTADHVVPLSRGGSNGDDNIVLACSECNTWRKNNVTGPEIKSTRKPKD